jgi:cytochrome c peroxidase
MIRVCIVLFISLFLFFSCKKGEISLVNEAYQLDEPSHFPKMIIPIDNPLTVNGVELGRKLFYEKKLSGDNSISCADCHSPQASFSDKRRYSKGITGQDGIRNSMALVNLGYQKFFFWDGRSKSLEDQILIPVEDPIEMHQSWTNAVIKLKADAHYRKEFYSAFGTDQVDSTLVAKAIAQFLRTMISGFSKYDVMYKQKYSLPLNPKEQTLLTSVTNEEWAGYDLFNSLNGGDCFHCHNGPLMHVELFSNNGLDQTFFDLGRGGITKNSSDYGKFKVPTLRNISVSGPYMHDGRFETLDEVIEHYSSGIKISPTISPSIEFANQGGVQLDAFEKGLIKKFLLTLTDEEFINNPKFAPPN